MDRPVNRDLGLWLSFFFTTTDLYSKRITADETPIHMSISGSVFTSLVKTPIFLNPSTDGIRMPKNLIKKFH